MDVATALLAFVALFLGEFYALRVVITENPLPVDFYYVTAALCAGSTGLVAIALSPEITESPRILNQVADTAEE
jgi:hypothetical protein